MLGSDSVWFTDLDFSLRHVDTGQALTVTGELYPHWGGGMMEVAGTPRGGAGQTWTVKFSRPPTVGELSRQV